MVRDYAKPLRRMPDLAPIPVDQRLPFAPDRIFVGQFERGPLLTGPNRVGFAISFSPRERGIQLSPRLGWQVKARVIRVDRRGRVVRLLGMHERSIERLRSTSAHPSGDLTLAFRLRRPGLYRIDLAIYDDHGSRLGQYGEYVRVLRPRRNARLAINQARFKRGETIEPRLENYGTSFLGFGLLGAHYEYFNGTKWTGASFGNGPTLAIGLGMGPGGSAACWDRQIPATAPPGRYRFSLRIEHQFQRMTRRRNRQILRTTFEILQ